MTSNNEISFGRLIILSVGIFLGCMVLPYCNRAEAVVQAGYIPPPLFITSLCDKETRVIGGKAATAAERRAYNGPAGEVGECAIRLSTARMLGFKGSRTELRKYNRYWASEVIRDCWEKYRRTVYKMAFCYNGGPRARVSRGHESHVYALEVQTMYRARYMALMKRT